MASLCSLIAGPQLEDLKDLWVQATYSELEGAFSPHTPPPVWPGEGTRGRALWCYPPLDSSDFVLWLQCFRIRAWWVRVQGEPELGLAPLLY